MNILVTGAKGFVGKNLCAALNNVKNGYDKTHPSLTIDEVYEYDIDSTPEELEKYCADADFVFNLAGVNRPKDNEEFMKGNFGFASTLLNTLKKHGNKCPIMLSSSIQATLAGRFGNSEYGRSKKAGEELFFKYGEETSAKVLVYRFPNLFGKWCRPNYNSAVATFCNNIANDLPIQVNDPNVELELLYIDDLIDEMFCALETNHIDATNLSNSSNSQEETEIRSICSIRSEHRCEFDGTMTEPSVNGRYCYCPITHKVKLGEIVELLNQFKAQPETLMIPSMPDGSFAKKLFATYLSYLPKEKAIYDLKMNIDDRGSFTELVKSIDKGQVSINISKPGITKGQHWHNTKWEIFIVVAGHALIQMRKEGCEEVIEYEVSGEHIQPVYMLPGYTHNIINQSETENLVTVMYCNETFDSQKPDTFHDDVK